MRRGVRESEGEEATAAVMMQTVWRGRAGRNDAKAKMKAAVRLLATTEEYVSTVELGTQMQFGVWK